MVMTANPSTLIQLAKLADARKDDLIRDIADGTLSEAANVPGEVRQALGRRISRKDTARADELEAIVERSGHVARDFWPGMQLLAIWTGGSVGAYLPALPTVTAKSRFATTASRRSEGRMSIPVADGTAAGILDVTTHFFEFIPESEYGRPDPKVLEVPRARGREELLHSAQAIRD